MDAATLYANGVKLGKAWLESAQEAEGSDAAAKGASKSAGEPLRNSTEDVVAAAPVARADSAQDSWPDSQPVPAQAAAGQSAALQTGEEAGTRRAIYADAPMAAPAGSVPVLAPMRGLTVGSLDAPPVGPNPTEARHSVGGQRMAVALVAIALVPPIVTALVLGLSHRAHVIPFAAVWSWMAALGALWLTVRAAVAASSGRTAGAWVAPVLMGGLLLIPSALVLYLRLVLSPVPLRLAAAQMVLYGMMLVALLFGSLGVAAE